VQIPVQSSRLKGGVSDQIDEYGLANEVRALLNQPVDAWPRKLVTADATVTTAWSDALPANSVGDFMVTAVGYVAGAATTAGYRRRVVVRRPGAGALVLVGGAIDVIGLDKEDDPTWDVTFALNSPANGSLAVTVQGAAATSITWRVHVEGLVAPWE